MTLQEIFGKIAEKLTLILQEKKTGKIRFDVELNLSQGGISDCFIETHTKERLKDEHGSMDTRKV